MFPDFFPRATPKLIARDYIKRVMWGRERREESFFKWPPYFSFFCLLVYDEAFFVECSTGERERRENLINR